MTEHMRTPEPIAFLRIARYALLDYRKRTGSYTSNWRDLGFPFSGKPFNVHDEGVFPPSSSEWNPKDSNFTYLLSLQPADDFKVSAMDDTGATLWTITRQMEWPERVRDADELRGAKG
jgi:hypothetical protein